MEHIKFPELFGNLDKIHMDISEMALVRVGNEWQAQQVCSVFSRIYMVMEGHAEISYRGKTVLLEPGNIYVIPAGLVFSYRCEQSMKKIYFHLSLLLPNHHDIFNRASECIVIRNQKNLIMQMNQMMTENRPSSVFAIKAFLYEIVLQCIRTDAQMDEKIENYSELVYKTQEYIRANLSAALTVMQVAEAMFLSPSKLQKLFKKEMGISVGRYIDDCLMYAAEREVRRGEHSVNEISTMLGFCDQFYFSRCFAKRYGVPPLRYRKMFQP